MIYGISLGVLFLFYFFFKSSSRSCDYFFSFSSIGRGKKYLSDITSCACLLCGRCGDVRAVPPLTIFSSAVFGHLRSDLTPGLEAGVLCTAKERLNKN